MFFETDAASDPRQFHAPSLLRLNATSLLNRGPRLPTGSPGRAHPVRIAWESADKYGEAT